MTKIKTGFARRAGLVRALIVLGGLAAVQWPAQAEDPTLAVLETLQPGRWELRDKDSGAARSLCIGDPRLLLQVRHGAASCSRYIIANEARSLTVQYSCPGAGNGRTTLRVETARLVQIDTQGMADRSPFVHRFEGRRTGACEAQGRTAPQARRPEKTPRLGIR